MGCWGRGDARATMDMWGLVGFWMEFRIECDTLYEEDRCIPHCFEENGACDEGRGEEASGWVEKGVCLCWDGHIGVDCNYSLEESVNLYVFLGMIVVVSIISFFFMCGSGLGCMVDCA